MLSSNSKLPSVGALSFLRRAIFVLIIFRRGEGRSSTLVYGLDMGEVR